MTRSAQAGHERPRPSFSKFLLRAGRDMRDCTGDSTILAQRVKEAVIVSGVMRNNCANVLAVAVLISVTATASTLEVPQVYSVRQTNALSWLSADCAAIPETQPRKVQCAISQAFVEKPDPLTSEQASFLELLKDARSDKWLPNFESFCLSMGHAGTVETGEKELHRRVVRTCKAKDAKALIRSLMLGLACSKRNADKRPAGNPEEDITRQRVESACKSGDAVALADIVLRDATASGESCRVRLHVGKVTMTQASADLWVETTQRQYPGCSPAGMSRSCDVTAVESIWRQPGSRFWNYTKQVTVAPNATSDCQCWNSKSDWTRLDRVRLPADCKHFN